MTIDFVDIEDGLLSYPYLVGVFQGSHYKESKKNPPPLLTDILSTEKNLLHSLLCLWVLLAVLNIIFVNIFV